MRALVSVYDKAGIVEFAERLISLGWDIISTGGTQKHLEEANIPVLPVEDVTGFPDMLGGRVKTLHPHVHGGILYRREDAKDQSTVADFGIRGIDMVVNTLYPFEETVLNKDANSQDIIENIDIGGPSMIRAAAKNFQDVIVVSDPSDYEDIAAHLENNTLSLEVRKELAGKAFALTAYYDTLVANYFSKENKVTFPEYLTLGYKRSQTLRYGENPHQEAVYYKNPIQEDFILEQLHGKQLSYNNYNDIQACISLVTEFEEPAAVAVKHANPCGVAIGENVYEAYRKAYSSDPVSIYGGIVGLNREIDTQTAEALSEIFLEIVIAPGFTDEALEVLTQKKNIRLIKSENLNEFEGKPMTHRETIGGTLVQERDAELIKEASVTVTNREATEAEKADLKFAWKVAKYINSNGMVIAKDGTAIGLGHGEVRRVWALEKAIERSETDVTGGVVASDGFFFADTIETLAEAGIHAVIQPGGSIQDENVIATANEKNVAVMFTGMRHFKH